MTDTSRSNPPYAASPVGSPALAPLRRAQRRPHSPRTRDRPTRPRRSTFMRYLAMMGPAFIVGAWQFGPGNLVSAVQAGSLYSYTLIWVIALSTILAGLRRHEHPGRDHVRRLARRNHQEDPRQADRCGRRTWCLRHHLCFSVGNAVGAGLGLSLVLGGSPVRWTLACSVLVAAIMFARQAYRVIEKVVLGIVALMATSFIATAIITQPDWLAAGKGAVVPEVPGGVGLLLVALVGTNFSLNAAFYAHSPVSAVCAATSTARPPSPTPSPASSRPAS